MFGRRISGVQFGITCLYLRFYSIDCIIQIPDNKIDLLELIFHEIESFF